MRGLNATVLGIIGLIALALFYDFGTLSPCGILRETVRKRDGLAAILLIASLTLDLLPNTASFRRVDVLRF